MDETVNIFRYVFMDENLFLECTYISILHRSVYVKVVADDTVRDALRLLITDRGHSERRFQKLLATIEALQHAIELKPNESWLASASRLVKH